MKILLFILPLFVAMFAGSDTFAFADTYKILIPSGAADPQAPYFWSEKSTGVTTGEIIVYPGDSVEWQNADTAFHTITSVSRSGEKTELTKDDEDGLFDSGFFTAGKSYERQFNDNGDFYYYCSIHPYMYGTVHVVNDPGSVQSIDRVASGYSEDGLGFKVKYILDTNLQNTVRVDPDGRTLTFTISGDTENEQITFVLPPELIENPNAVWVDDTMVDFEIEEISTGTKLVIPIESHSKEIKIMGTYVIPEFGFLTMVVLCVGLVSTLFFTRSKFSFIG